MSVPIIPGAPGPDQPQFLPVMQPPPAPAPPRRGLSQGAIGGIVVGACVLATVAFFALGGSWPPKSGGSGDVTVESCGMSSARFAEANLLIRNSATVAHNYAISVTFKEGGVQVGTATAVVQDLAAGGVARDRVVSPVSARSVTCSVTDVNRY